VCSAFGALAGLLTAVRVWRHLGPTRTTLIGGVGFFGLAICGVLVTSVYRATGVEWLHVFIGGSFVASVVPLTLAVRYAVDDSEEGKIIAHDAHAERL
jgi:hypothetical protein